MKKYLIIPAMPTPNGPLHLGHIGGPYLRADIMARYLRQLGHHVIVLSGTDNYENYTQRQAVKEGVTPTEICNKYYPQIVAELKFMNIMLDNFINPHDDQWIEKYRSMCFGLLAQAESTGKIRVENGDYFLRLPQHVDLHHKGISDSLIHAYEKYLTKSHHETPLTSDSDWGFALSEGKTLLSYGFVYAYYLLLAGKNAFSKDSETTIIATFGVDNTIPILASVAGMSAVHENFKPVDYYIINYFYHVNGKKFSTSSRHAIWVSDIKQQNISVDILRFFLASIDVSAAVGDFSLDDFLQFHTRMAAAIELWMQVPVVPAHAPHTDSAELYQRIDQALQPHQFMPHLAVQAIQEWMNRGNTIVMQAEEYSAWLQALGVAVEPFMPQLAERIYLMTREQTTCINMM